MNSTASRRAAFGAAVLVFSMLLSGVRLLAQAPQPSGPARAPGALERDGSVAVTFDDRSADETRNQLRELLRQYPPSLGDVLRRDPTLATNQAYLANYPKLSAFLAQHPQVAHNPAYFFGEYREYEADPRRDAINMWEQTMAVVAGIFVFLVVTTVLAWLIRTLIDYRRWLRLSKVQTEAHSKLLDRFSSNEDLLAYIQSSPGRKFLESAPIPLDIGPRSIGAPLGRILWSVQAGLVLALGGLGLQYVSRGIINEAAQPIFAMGVLALMFGVGFILSAVVAYVLSRRLGLLETPSGAPASPHPAASDQP